MQKLLEKTLYKCVIEQNREIRFIPVEEIQDKNLIVMDNTLLSKCSMKIDQILRVFLKMKLDKIDFKVAVKEVAKELEIKETTVRDKCTRKLGLDTDKFVNYVQDYLQGDNDKLKEKLLDKARNNKFDKIAIEHFLSK